MFKPWLIFYRIRIMRITLVIRANSDNINHSNHSYSQQSPLSPQISPPPPVPNINHINLASSTSSLTNNYHHSQTSIIPHFNSQGYQNRQLRKV